ncbi:MAG: PepSY-like domain-containing protein [Bacteroidales bacterium]
MKLNVGLFSFLLGGLLLFAGCSNDDDDVIKGNTPNEQIVSAFKKQFPDATEVKWNTRNGYSVASFRLPQNPTGDTNEAWYESNGECALSEIEISNFNQLPAAVQEGYNATVYATDGWQIDDIDALTRQGMALVYKIEIEKAGQEDHDLLFTAGGVLISDKIDTDDDDDENVPVVIPSAILDFVHQNMNGAVILDFDKENNEFELEVTYKNAQVELYFTLAHKFLRAEEEFPESDLPEAVKTALNEYTTQWEIDDVIRVTYADKSIVYVIELENKTTDAEKVIKFNPDGTLI